MKKFFAKICRKNGIAKRIVSMSLALLMVLSTLQALPAGILVANAANENTNIKIHFYNQYGWSEPAMQYWGGSSSTVSGKSAEGVIEGWGGVTGYSLTSDGDNWYSISISGDFENVQFLDMQAPGNNTGGGIGNAYVLACKGDTATDLYVKHADTDDDGNGDAWKWYTDANFTSELTSSEPQTKITINLGIPTSWNWVRPTMQYWGSSTTTLTGYGAKEAIPNWGVDGYTLTSVGTENDLAWYTITLSGDLTGIGTQFLDISNPDSNTGGSIFIQELLGDEYKEDTPTNVYVSYVNNAWTWYKDKALTSTVITGPQTNITVNLGIPTSWNWARPTLQYWGAGPELSGYGAKEAIPNWGVDGYTLTSVGTENDLAWYTITLSGNLTGIGTQFLDISNPDSNTGGSIFSNELLSDDYVSETPVNVYVSYVNNAWTWYKDKALTTPLVPESAFSEQTITMHFQKPDVWEGVSVKATQGSSWTDIDGYGYCNAWPGVAVEADPDNEGWYSFKITMEPGQFNCIFNNGIESDVKQTENICFTPSAENTEKWVTITDTSVHPQTTVVSDDAPSGWTTNTQTINPPVDPLAGTNYASPVVDGNEVTFTFVDTSNSIQELYLRGTVTNWDPGVKFDNKEGNVFTHTITVNPGKYTYKFWSAPDNWTKDELNKKPTDGDGNSILIVPGLYAGSPIEAQKGIDFALPASLNYIDASGNETTKPVTYTLKNAENSSFVTITNGNTLKATMGCAENAVDLIATANSGETAVVTVKLVDKIYTYTVYAYSPIADRVNVNNAALYIWDKAGETSLEAGDYAFTSTETLADGKTWLKAEVQLSCAQAIGFIFKCRGSWDWQTADLIFANTDKTDKTIYLVDGYDKVYTSLDEVPTISQLCIEYTRGDSNYVNPYVEVWNNGYSYKENGSTKNFTYNFDNSTGKYIVNIPIALGTKDRNVGFNIYNNGEIDGTAQTVTIKAGEKLTKVKYNNGQLTVVPDSSGYVADRENNKISFYYRDEAKFLTNQMHTIGSVKLAIRRAVGSSAVTAEELIDMTYDANDERFELENQDLPNDSDVYYYFVVDGTNVLDAKNSRRTTIDGKEYCMVRNRAYNINLQASVKYSDMTSDDGNVLYVTYTEVDGFNPEKITVDLSALGLGNKVEMDKELMALSFGCLDGTSVGTKAIKVTLTDDSDMTYTATAQVSVKARTKTANTSTKLGTFDWDEAVIYFAVTDRFFDGNTSNNLGDPNSSADDAAFDKNNAGSYHGGDFAGLTAKIDYLYNLGVNTIWITPIVDNVDGDFGTQEDGSYYAYHGYWASDFTKLNPHLGNEAEFKALVDAAHAKGMKIMVDVVINHAGYGNEQEDTTTYFNNIINGTMMIRDDANTEAGDIKVHTSGLPDFMTEDPVVREQLITWQTDWLKYGVDYYRVDTVKHVENTTWNAFKNALVEKDQDFKLIGEYFDAGYLNDYEQLDTGRMDSILDFNFNDIMLKLVDEDLAGIENALSARNLTLTNTATVGSFTSSHDEDGLLYTMSKSKDDWAKSLMKVAATYQATAKGQPVIYYGEEIGLTGANDWPIYTNRPDFDWTLQATQAADSNSMYNHYKKVLNIRRNYSEVFAKGTRTTVVPDSGDGYEVFSRSYEGKTLYVGVNVWGDARTTTFYVPGAAGTVYTDLYSRNTYTVKADGTLTITIPGAQDGGTAILVGTGVVVNDTNEITVKIHYTRNDGNYTGWNLWAWTEGAGGAQYDFVKEGNDMVATVTGLPGRTTTRMGYHTRLNDWKAQDYSSDQWVDLSDVVSGTVHYYINSSSYGGTRVLGSDVVLGSKIVTTSYNRNTNVVTVNMSTPINGSALDAFKIMCTSTDTRIDIESVEKNGNQYFLTLKQDISSLEALLLSYTISYDGYTYNLMTPNVYSTEEFEDAYTYTGNDLGLTYTSAASTFKLWAPTADSVTLNIYSGGTAGTDDKIASYPMTGGTKADKGVWTYTLNGDYNGKYYTYTVNVANKVNEACDPYARTTGVNGKRAMILDLASTNPAGWDADKNAKRHDGMNYTDAVIYELHVRDLSIDSSSGVDSKYQGKFLGLTQTGTKTAGGNPTALDHMINLGITHLHLIPVYDYGSVDETKLDTPQFNWGYDPVNYNVPEGSYSTNPYDGSVRVKEMKQMIKTLHDNNINVVMDVVYNHVYDADSFAFNQAVPKYFSRTKEDGTYSSRSGCGNDTASERSMVHKYIVDSILYWHEEYHIDGFRFDLVGLLDTVTINKIVADVHAIDPDIIFYGEGWDMDDTVMSKDGYDMAKQGNASKTPGFAYFSDNIRNGIAGSDTDGKGLIWGQQRTDSDIVKLALGQSWWSKNPSQAVNYVSCHDNYTLFDKINVVSGANVTSYNYTPGADQVALNNLAAAYYMFAAGIPLVHAGEDMLRIKLDSTGEVIHNSYNSPDSVNKIRWSNLDTAIYKDTTDYYKGLIEFRKNHAALRLSSQALVEANMTATQHSTNVIVTTYKGKDNVAGEVSDGIVTIFNASNNAVTISNNYGITSGTEWKVCVNKDNAGTEVLETITNGSVTVPAHSVMALVKGETVDTNSIYDQNNTVTLTVDKTTLTTGIGGVVAINATTNIPATLTWVSSNTNVATVDAQGRVTAVAEGNATITVSTYHGVEATCVVTVTNEAVESTITIDKTTLALVAGESDTLVITASPVGSVVTYTSSDESVATIDENGTVTAVAAGSAIITASLADGQSVSCTVTVEAAPEEVIIALNKDTMSLTEGDSEKLVAVVTPAGTTVTFSSKNTNVATVDQYGNVTAVAEGNAEIIVVASTGKTAICTVTVTKAEENQGGSEPDGDEPEPTPNEPEPTPTPNPVPSTPDSDASTGAGNGAAAGVNPGATTTIPTTPEVEEEEETTVEIETEAETEVPEIVEEVTPIVDEKLQNAIANETEKILEDVLNDDVSEEVMSEETLEKVKEALENGDGIVTEIIVDKLDEADVKDEVKEAFEKVLAESFKDKKGAETKIAQYLDLSVLLKTTQGQELGAVHKLSKEMTFTIAVPEELVKEGRTFVVLRIHEGVTTVLDTLMNADGTLSFKTDRFSEYALAYVDVEPEEVKEDEEGTEGDVPSGATTTEEDGNNMTTFVVVGLVIVILVALAGIFFALKRKKNN